MNLNDLYEMRDPRDAYQRDVDNSTSGFGKDSYAYRADGGANDENHSLDQQSSTWYIRLNGKLIQDKSGNPYAFQDKAAANKAALTMQAKLFNKDKEFKLTTNPNESFDPLKHIEKKNQNPAVKQAANDVDRGDYAARVALMKAGNVKDDRGPVGVTSGMEEGIVGNMVNKAKSMFTKPASPAAPAPAPQAAAPAAPAPVVPNAATQARMAAAPQGYDPNTGKPLVAAKAAPGAVAKGGTMAMTKKVTPVAKPATAKPAPAPAPQAAAPAAPAGVQGIKSNVDVNTLQKFNGIVDVTPKIQPAPQVKDAKGRTWTKLSGGWTQDGTSREIDRQDSTYLAFDDAWRVANGAQPGNVGVPKGVTEDKLYEDIQRMTQLAGLTK